MRFRQVVTNAVNRAVDTLDGVAGKSINVAKVLRALGEHPVALGFLGGERGSQLRAIMESRGIELDFVTVTTPTRQCVTVIDESSGAITELVEESRPVEAEAYARLMEIVRRRIGSCGALVMSGTIASGGPADLYFQCARLAHEAGGLPVADASGLALIEALKAKPGLVKPNRVELEATVGRALTGEEEVRSAMRELVERGAQRVVVTAGAEPTLAFDGQRFWRIASPRVTAVNPIGSGDSFTAGLVWRLLRGDDLGEACRWGSATGAANALTAMAGEVNRADMERLVREVTAERI